MVEKKRFHCPLIAEVPISSYCFYVDNPNLAPTELPSLPFVPNSPITPRQLEIYRWILRGVKQKAIAELVNSSVNTVKQQLAKSKEKINKKSTSNRDSISTALFCLQQGYIHPDEVDYLKAFYGKILLDRFTSVIVPHQMWIDSICDLALGVTLKEVAIYQFRSEEAVKTHLEDSAKELYLPCLKSDVMVMLAILSGVIELSELDLQASALEYS